MKCCWPRPKRPLWRYGNRHRLGVPPQAFQVVVFSRFRGEDVNQKIAIVGQHPLGVLETFHAYGTFTALVQLRADLFGDGLNLFGVAAGGDYEEVGERGDFAQIEHSNVGGFLRFSGAGCDEPGRS